MVISPVRLYYVKHLGFETGIHKQRWQYSGFGSTPLFHKEKIVPRFTISRNTENLANTRRKEGKQKIKVLLLKNLTLKTLIQSQSMGKVHSYRNTD